MFISTMTPTQVAINVPLICNEVPFVPYGFYDMRLLGIVAKDIAKAFAHAEAKPGDEILRACARDAGTGGFVAMPL